MLVRDAFDTHIHMVKAPLDILAWELSGRAAAVASQTLEKQPLLLIASRSEPVSAT